MEESVLGYAWGAVHVSRSPFAVRRSPFPVPLPEAGRGVSVRYLLCFADGGVVEEAFEVAEVLLGGGEVAFFVVAVGGHVGDGFEFHVLEAPGGVFRVIDVVADRVEPATMISGWSFWTSGSRAGFALRVVPTWGRTPRCSRMRSKGESAIERATEAGGCLREEM